jgi:aminoglycoside phosphotransferase (APT) family kinase protein
VDTLLPVDTLRARLVGFLERTHGPGTVRVEDLRLLTGGASRQTWAFDALISTADGAVARWPLVLRSDGPRDASFMSRDVEYRVLQAAADAGVPVPRPNRMGDDSLGTPFFLMERVEGETIPRRILRDDIYAGARRVMVRQLGMTLARVHRIPVTRDGQPLIAGNLAPATSPAAAELARYEEIYRSTALDAHPVFELAFRWLRERLPGGNASNAPTGERDSSTALVHGDYRLGNFIVGPEGLRAVLDWELAHIGDPLEDLGWLCVRSWRFGNDALPAAGCGEREELWDAYESAGGTPVEPRHARFWEAFGNLRWGVICMVQSRPAIDGHLASVELASIGRRVAETEWELLELMEAS